VVAFDQCTDAFDSGAHVMQAAADPVALKNPGVRWFYDTALWTLGTKGIEDTLQAGKRYKLLPIADRICQDVLILAGAEDHFNPFHQVADFEKALVNARSVTTRVFDRPSGGAEHCQGGNTSLVHAAVFDWLLAKFPRPVQR
jgi:hypothetical protein